MNKKEVINIKNNTKIISTIVVIVFGILAFFAGMQYQKTQAISGLQGFSNRARGTNPTGAIRFGGAGGRSGQAVIGEILSTDDKSMTVKLQDESSKIIILSGTTSVNKQATGTKDDLKTGERVAVFGTNNSDGSVTAQSIQLNPTFGTRLGMTPTPTQ